MSTPVHRGEGKQICILGISKDLCVPIGANFLDNFGYIVHTAFFLVTCRMQWSINSRFKTSASEQFLSEEQKIPKSLNPSHFKQLQAAFVLNHVSPVQAMLALITGNESFAAGWGCLLGSSHFKRVLLCQWGAHPLQHLNVVPSRVRSVWGQWLCPSEDWAAPLLRQKSEQQLRRERMRNGNWAGTKKGRRADIKRRR